MKSLVPVYTKYAHDPKDNRVNCWTLKITNASIRQYRCVGRVLFNQLLNANTYQGLPLGTLEEIHVLSLVSKRLQRSEGETMGRRNT